MSSTFGILEAARSGLNAAQLGLNVTSQNTANADTVGYTRQAIDVSAKSPDMGAYRYANSSAQVGQGVNVNGVYQIRNEFLDVRYREANSTYNLYNGMQSQLTPIEDQFNEISADTATTNKLTGLSGSVDSLITSLQEYQTSPTSTTISSDVEAKADFLASLIRSDAAYLTDTLASENKELNIYVTGGSGDTSNGNDTSGVNGMIEEIQSLNKEIASYEISGQTANDLRDTRNNVLDKLSSYIDITTTEQPNGMVTVSLKNDSSKSIIDSINTANEFQIVPATATTPATLNWGKSITATGTVTDATASEPVANVQGGLVKAYLNVINGDGSGTDDSATGQCGNAGIPYLQSQLDKFAAAFADIMNSTYDAATSTSVKLIDGVSAATIAVDSAWVADATQFTNGIADSGLSAYYTNYITALSKTTVSGYSGTFSSFADSFTGDLASAVSSVSEKASSFNTTTTNLDNQRKSISSVSTNDEGVNLIKYQQSYNANARVITAIDSMLDKLINGTGTVGLS